MGDDSNSQHENPFNERIPASTFAHWITPAQAVNRLGYHYTTARTQLVRELENGLLLGSAAKAIWRYRTDEGDDDFVIMPKWAWALVKRDLPSDFWSTGFLEMMIPGPSAGYGIRSDEWIRFFDVRFDPARFESPSPAPPGSTQVADPEEKPSVSKADLARWHDVFKAVHPQAPEALALQSAAAMFPNHRVPRQWVRDLRGPQKRGKPPTRHK